MVAKRKAVWVSEELWERLMKLKIEMRARSLEEVIARLLGQPVEASPSEKQTSPAIPAETGTQPSQPRAEDAATESRPTQPTVSLAGINAAPPPRKHRWAFCPKCLNMYDSQGKCPHCDVDLIPLDTEENKMRYRKLKQERG